MKITIDRATVEQALEALEQMVVGTEYEVAVEAERVMDTLRAALAEPVQEPVARSLTEDERAAIEYFALNPSMAVLAFSHWLRRDKSAPLQRPAEPDTDCHAQGICQRSGYGIN